MNYTESTKLSALLVMLENGIVRNLSDVLATGASARGRATDKDYPQEQTRRFGRSLAILTEATSY